MGQISYVLITFNFGLIRKLFTIICLEGILKLVVRLMSLFVRKVHFALFNLFFWFKV